jgi:thiol:disulfide interchange protein/DsbC/DsbD-like thiol-disulfide interchange protein
MSTPPGPSRPPRLRIFRSPGATFRAALLAGLLALVAAPALAQGLPLPPAGEAAQRRVQAELLPETLAAAPGSTVTALLRMRIAPGWHTYWRNPGDSGLPASLDWALPPGVEAGGIQWPVPGRLPVGPLMNYGYEREALLLVPLRISPAFSGARLGVSARAEWLVCREVCIPESTLVAFEIPVAAREPQADPRLRALFAQARAALPTGSGDWRVNATADATRLAVTLQPPPGQPLPSGPAYFFEGTGNTVVHARAQSWARHRDGLRIDVPLQPGVSPAAVDGLVVIDAASPAETRLALAVETAPARALPDLGPALASGASGGVGGSPGPDTSAAGPGLALALLLAVLGGLALNLMPCVFPVLSIKLLTLAGECHARGGGAGRHALAYTAGVLATFWLLAGILLALRGAGEQVGWGFQLQSPGFVAALAVLFTLLALNLAGVFEVGGRLAGAAGAAATGSGLRGAFLNGALAVAVAAPCTAPFMGAALGYGLAQPAPVTLAVFTALAAGMALPFATLAWVPALARRLPRPGPWMASLRQAMAFPLLATVAWLAWVLGAQAGNDAVFALACGLVAVAMGAWIWGRFGQGETRRRRRLAASALAAATALSGIALAWPDDTSRPVAVAEAAWDTWSEETVARHRAAGRPVFIDFTAAWCVTCQVNKRVVLDSPAVARRFAEADVIALRADWTRRDPAITQALQRYGRSGVPVYVLYLPGASGPLLLPEILTRDSVLAALATR